MTYRALPVFLLSLAALVPAAPAATITVTTIDNASTAADGLTSLYEAIQQAGAGDTIAFNIPGAGPHIIKTPVGGYPLITADHLTIDGYTQPGSSPNTNPILGGNNAKIQIVLDSTGTNSAPNPDPINFPARPLRQSTRLDFPDQSGNTGYGETEDAILGIYQADNVTIRGLSFIARHTSGDENDPSIYCIALVREALNAKVQGCWFGLAPGGTSMADLHPAASAVAAFRWRIGGDVYSGGLHFGTDGDGINDRAEFNVLLGGRIGLALELPNPKISGNYFNVFPDGNTFVDVEAVRQQLLELNGGEHVENIENGRVTDNTIIGTDGDGIADSDERNIFAHAEYDHDIEFYSTANGAIVAGNYFGVGIDGVTASPHITNPDASFDFISLPGSGASIRVGSNGDGVSDDLEGNLIVNVQGSKFVESGGSVPIVSRGNRMVNNSFKAIPFAEGQNAPDYGSYYASVVADPATIVPVLQPITGTTLKGKFGAPLAAYPGVIIDLYLIDPAAVARRDYWPLPLLHTLSKLGTYRDNGAGDLNPNANEFTFDLSSFGLADDTLVGVAVTYSTNATKFDVGSYTTPLAVVSKRPRVTFTPLSPTQNEVSWIAPQGAYKLQANVMLDDNWFDVTDAPAYTSGRSVVLPFFDIFAPIEFYRLISQ